MTALAQTGSAGSWPQTSGAESVCWCVAPVWLLAGARGWSQLESGKYKCRCQMWTSIYTFLEEQNTAVAASLQCESLMMLMQQMITLQFAYSACIPCFPWIWLFSHTLMFSGHISPPVGVSCELANNNLEASEGQRSWTFRNTPINSLTFNLEALRTSVGSDTWQMTAHQYDWQLGTGTLTNWDGGGRGDQYNPSLKGKLCTFTYTQKKTKNRWRAEIRLHNLYLDF